MINSHNDTFLHLSYSSKDSIFCYDVLAAQNGERVFVLLGRPIDKILEIYV